MTSYTYIKVSAQVRYWEDAYLNGVEDIDGNMPLRHGDLWEPTIDLQTGKILNWPNGFDAKIHYKVCDAGEYFLLDQDQNTVAKYKGFYVPDDILCIDDDGYGDYIIFQIQKDGKILNWKQPNIESDYWNEI